MLRIHEYCIAGMLGRVNVLGELPEKSSWQKKFGDWTDFGHKDTINKLKFGWPQTIS